jgi:hypothetical protein
MRRRDDAACRNAYWQLLHIATQTMVTFTAIFLVTFLCILNNCRGFSSTQNALEKNQRSLSYQRKQPQWTTDTSTAVEEVNALTHHPAVLWDESTALSNARKKLKPRHLPLFESSTNSTSIPKTDLGVLFDEFASAICLSGAVARKEVFETWTAALFIHERFFAGPECNDSMRRVADVAGGHGLLAWALLVLDDHYCTTNSQAASDNKLSPPPLTAFTIDCKMPRSADAISATMLERYPHLEGRFDFVEARLEQLRPHPSCLLVSVHACAGLSDVLVATAAAHSCRIALVPCCHSRKKKQLEGIAATSLAKQEYQAIIDIPSNTAIPDLADLLDNARITVLKMAGFDVDTARLPALFTAKNLLILASPSLIKMPPRETSKEQQKERQLLSPRQMPPLAASSRQSSSNNQQQMTAKALFLQKFDVPCDDTADCRATVKSLAGREEAERRQSSLHRKKHADAPELDVSMWLPDDIPQQRRNANWEASLAALVQSYAPSANCVVGQFGPAFVHPTSGRTSQTFRFRYYQAQTHQGSSSARTTPNVALPSDRAKQIHGELFERIPVAFPGVECR